jgi:hypothetical protein
MLTSKKYYLIFLAIIIIENIILFYGAGEYVRHNINNEQMLANRGIRLACESIEVGDFITVSLLKLKGYSTHAFFHDDHVMVSFSDEISSTNTVRGLGLEFGDDMKVVKKECGNL